MEITQLLSGKGTHKLGDFEVKYIWDKNAEKVLERYYSFNVVWKISLKYHYRTLFLPTTSQRFKNVSKHIFIHLLVM